MSEAAAPGDGAARGGALPAGSAPGKDYWDIVRAQMRRRPSVRIAAVLLVLLYAPAIYAPFLAGDRPLLLVGTDAASYKRAQRSLTAPARSLQKLVVEGREAYAARSATRSFDEALADERGALEQRVATMEEQL